MQWIQSLPLQIVRIKPKRNGTEKGKTEKQMHVFQIMIKSKSFGKWFFFFCTQKRINKSIKVFRLWNMKKLNSVCFASNLLLIMSAFSSTFFGWIFHFLLFRMRSNRSSLHSNDFISWLNYPNESWRKVGKQKEMNWITWFGEYFSPVSNTQFELNFAFIIAKEEFKNLNWIRSQFISVACFCLVSSAWFLFFEFMTSFDAHPEE